MSQPRSLLRFSSLGMILAAGAGLSAQATTGGLSGLVTNAKGQPLAGAKVLLSSPAMFASRMLTTDANGQWQAQLLPVGAYRVQASKEGFVGAEATNLRVGIGTTSHQALALKPIEQQSVVVEVTGATSEVDLADTKASTNYSAEALDKIATMDRSFYGAADLTPGVALSSNGGISVRGGATQNTLFRVNGTDIKDDLQGAQVGTWVIEDNIADVQVVLSPLNARNGRALGGQVNVVTKTGGNGFEGSFRAHLSRPTWGAANPYSKDIPGWTSDKLTRTYDVTLSGPVVKDRLWFSLGTILTPTSTSTGETGQATPLAQGPQRTMNPLVDGLLGSVPSGYAFATTLLASHPYTSTYDSSYFEGKLTGALSENHTLELSGTVSDNTIGNRNPGVPIRRVEALGTQKGKQAAWGLNYRGIFGPSTFLEARYNRYLSQATFPTGDPRFSSNAVDVWMDSVGSLPHNFYDVGYPFGLGVTPRPDKRNNTSGNANLTLYRDAMGGHHTLDLGVEYYQFDRQTTSQTGADNRSFRVGGAYYNAAAQDWLFPSIVWPGKGVFGQSLSGNTGLAPVMFQNLGKDGITKNTTTSLYANDSVSIGKQWVVMAGLRLDMIRVTNTDGSTLAKASDVSPRFQVKVDVKGDGKHVLTGTAARFQGDFTAGFTSSFVSTATSRGVSYGFAGLPGQVSVWDANATLSNVFRWLTYAQLTDPRNYTHTATDLNGNRSSTAFAYFDNSQSYLVDKNLKAPHMDEVTLTYRRTYESGSYIRFTGVHREWKQEWAFSTDYAVDQMVTIHDPSGSGLADRLANTVRIFNSSALTRRYHALEVELLRNLGASLTLNGSYTYGRLTGNSNGGDSPLSTFRDNSIPGYYSQRRYLTGTLGLTDKDIAPDGPLNADQTHTLRVGLTLERPLDRGRISYSAMFRYDSGTPWSAAGARPLSAGANAYMTSLGYTGYTGGMADIANAPSAPTSFTQFYGGRGQYRYNDTYTVDAKISWRFPLGYKAVQLVGDLQVGNLFNHMVQATYATSRAPLPYGANALFLNTTGYGTFGGANPEEGNYWLGGRSMGTSIGLRF